MPNDVDYIANQSDVLAGSIVSLESVVGGILLTIVIVRVSFSPSMKYSFGIMIINQNIAELIPCLSCFILFFFGVVLDLKLILHNSHLSGFSINVTIMVMLSTCFLMSINRLFSIAFPILYRSIFTGPNTKIFIFILWTFSIIASLYLHFIRNCFLVLQRHGWHFIEESSNEKCDNMLNKYRVTGQMFLTYSMLFIDLLTFAVLITRRKKLYASKSIDVRRREMSFFRQIILQGVIFTIHGILYQNRKRWFPDDSSKWISFFLTSIYPNMMHIFVPIVYFLCNPDFKDWVLKRRIRQQSAVVMSN